MTAEEKFFTEIGQGLKGAEISQMFGKPCFKIKGKAFACLFDNSMVFKLTGKSHELALGMKGSVLFDPSGKKRPMKEWIQVPFRHKVNWPGLAKEAMSYVKSNS